MNCILFCWEFFNYVSPLGNAADRCWRNTHTLQLFRNARASAVIQVLENTVNGSFASFNGVRTSVLQSVSIFFLSASPKKYRRCTRCVRSAKNTKTQSKCDEYAHHGGDVASPQLFSTLFSCFVTSLLTAPNFNPVHIYSKCIIYSLMV